jgi:FkbM family methyltransferase
MHEDIKNLLIPYFVTDLKRYGQNGDGGYILSESLLSNTKYIYSYGVGNIEECISFDRQMVSLSKEVYLYDGTMDKFWEEEKQFHFKKENVNSQTIYSHLVENNHLNETNIVLKMDVEGSEYETLLNCSPHIFTCFNQLALELHGVISDRRETAVNLLNLLNKNYYLVHIHGNNHDLIIEDGICSSLEITYIRKDCFNEPLPISPFACPREGLDFKNYLYRDDVKMNWWLKNEI